MLSQFQLLLIISQIGSNTTLNMNETTSSTNLSTATDINGTLTSITPEDIQDRRHAPS